MLQTTIGDLLDGSIDVTGYRLYVVKNGEEVLYAGQSSNVRIRMRGHVSTRGILNGSLLGQAIYEHEPRSREWEVDLYTVDECSGLIRKYFPYAPRLGIELYSTETRAMEDFAEDALIHHFAPRYNLAINIWRHPHSTPFTERRRENPYLQQRMKAAEEGKKQEALKWKEKQESLVNSVCTICGEHDRWQRANGEPCGVIGSVTISSVKNPEERITIPLVCHDCNTIINSLRELEKEADRVQKVKDAIEKRRIEASILAAHS